MTLKLSFRCWRGLLDNKPKAVNWVGNSTGSLTTRWSGPGILRQKQEMIEMRAPARECEGAFPGRSARSRYAAQGLKEE